MKIIVAGSRDIRDLRLVYGAYRAALDSWGNPPVELIIHGGGRGVDTVIHRWARVNMFPVRAFRADWLVCGKAAGPRRNQEMADFCEPGVDGLVAIPGPDSRGTWDMVRRAKKRGLKVYIAKAVES